VSLSIWCASQESNLHPTVIGRVLCH